MEETSQFVPNNYGIQNIYYGTVINVYYNEYRMCDSAYNTCRESTTVEDDEIFEEDAPQDGELIEKLKPIFYNNEEDVRLFLKEIKGMKQKDITDLVNKWVEEKRISDYGNSRKGDLWSILKDAGLYAKSRQNWCRRVY
jgi:hypothetical protein